MKTMCEVCEKPISNWKGNVMIPRNSFDGEINDLQVWCKQCTSKLDEQGLGREYHNIWELSWVKEDKEKIFEESDYADRFSNDVKTKVNNLINIARQE